MDDVQNRLHQVGPFYGVQDYIKKINRSWSTGMEEAPWVLAAQACHKARVPPRIAANFIIDKMMDEDVSEAIMSHELYEGRRLGKPFVEIDLQLGQAAVLTQRIGDNPRKEEAITNFDLLLHIEGDRTIGTLAPGRIAITRHALERLYERENIPTGGLWAEIRQTIASVRRRIALAVEAGISLNELPDARNLARTRGSSTCAVQLVPCSSGLLIVEVVYCVMMRDEYPVARLDTRKGGTFSRSPPQFHPSIECRNIKGVDFITGPLHIGRTYLSWDILRDEQKEYLDRFLALEAQCDMDSIARRVFGMKDRHRVTKDLDAMNIPDASELQALLPRCINKASHAHGAWSMKPGLMPGR